MKTAAQNTFKNLAIGLVVLLALFFTVRSLLFLHPRPGDGKLILNVRFQNIDKLSKGTKITFAGKPVGEVLSITPVIEPRTDNLQKGIYPYELKLAIDSAIRVYDTDEIAVKTAGLMGERFIAITPQPVPPGITPKLLENDEIVYASSGLNVDETVTELSNVVKKAEKTMDGLLDIIQKNHDGLNVTMQALERATVQFDQLLTRINQVDIPGSAARTLEHAENLMESFKGLLSQFQNSQTLENVDAISAHLRSITANLDNPERIQGLMLSLEKATDQFSDVLRTVKASWPESTGSFDSVMADFRDSIKKIHDVASKTDSIVTKIADGQGSIGHLICDDEAYYRSLRVMNRTDLLLSDINNYGILFHLDRTWQRQRRSRVEEAAQLTTATQIRTFVDEEMQSIFVSCQRLDDALARAQTSAESPDSLKNPQVRQEFTDSYKELLRSVQALESRLKTVGTVLGEELSTEHGAKS